MKTRHLFLICTIVFFVLIPLTSAAQEEAQEEAQEKLRDHVVEWVSKVGVHVNVSVRDPVDPDVTKGVTFGPSIGLSPGRTNGWRYPVGITMFSEDLNANGQKFGTMRTRAILAGIGYGWHFGRLSTGLALQTGYAFNSGQTHGDLQQVFGVTTGTVSLDVDNSLFLRPQAKAEDFLTPKFTVRISADYMLLRPNIAVTTPDGRVANRWDASNVHANVGIGWYPFRK